MTCTSFALHFPPLNSPIITNHRNSQQFLPKKSHFHHHYHHQHTCRSSSSSLNSPIITKHRNSHQFLQKTSHFHHHHQHQHQHQHHQHTCRASSSSSSTSASSCWITEYDLYDLMGIESCSDQSQIKRAYRSLQKRCHPDIAGPAGHDMAIILNEAYDVLSDPVSRSAYDKEQAKTTELRGYTGRPMYSVWLGPESEQRAVFVDEVKCVGCLKCALFADKTFAIESAYGRARVVAQWADPEDKIQASIDACPVNCISMVERSDLAALEFLMSKQPRGKVRIGASNTSGARVFDVFSEVKVLHKRLEEAVNRKSHQDSKYSRLHRDARLSAIQTIRSISNWLYWQSPTSEAPSDLTLRREETSTEPAGINKLRDAAAAARKHGMLKTREHTRLLPQTTSRDEYWVPSTPVHPLETKNKSHPHTTIQTRGTKDGKDTYGKMDIKRKKKERSHVVSGVPMGLAMIAAVTVRLQGAGETIRGLEGHIGGSFALQAVNSSWLQVVLAGATWYLIGVAIIQLVENLTSRDED